MHRIGRFTSHRSTWILIGAVITLIIAGVYGTSVFEKLQTGSFEDANSESSSVSKELRENFKNTGADIVVLLSRGDGKSITDPTFAKEATALLDTVAKNPDVTAVTSYYSTASPSLLSRDGTKTFATLQLKGDLNTKLQALPEIEKQLASSTLKVQLGGFVPTNQAFSNIIKEDLTRAEILSFSVLSVLLLVVFRSVIAALLPILLGGFAIMGAFLLTRILTNFMDVSQYAINIIIFLGLGLAIDYSLFIVSRFREELRATGDVHESIATTMATAGRAVLYSGITVVISLLGLLVFPLSFERSMGIGGAAAVVVALVGALLVLPAMLAKLGNNVNALSFGSVKRDQMLVKSGTFVNDSAPTGWYKISKFVMRHPIAIIALTLVPLLLAGAPFLRVQLTSPDYRSLPKAEQSYIVAHTLKTDFPQAGDPIQIVIHSNEPVTSPSSLQTLDTFVRSIENVPGVTSVESLPSSLRNVPATMVETLITSTGTARTPLVSRYVSSDGNSTVVNAYFDGDTYGTAARTIVSDIRALTPPSGVDVKVGGEAARLTDMVQTLVTYMPYALAFIISALLILLFLMIGSVLIPIKAVILNLLSLSASFGALVWIFQDGNLENILHFESVGAIDANQPILIFAIAFGLSMDYAVFLLSRIKEQYDKTGNTEDSIAEGIKKTGGIITSAALMLIVVVGAFGTSQIPLMKQIAIGLVLAIAIDAVIVRMLLIPATMKLLGKYNWWAPKPLLRLYHWVNLKD